MSIKIRNSDIYFTQNQHALDYVGITWPNITPLISTVNIVVMDML